MHHTYIVPSLPSQSNRILIPTDRLGSKSNDSYRLQRTHKHFPTPSPSLHTIHNKTNLANNIIHKSITSTKLT